MKLTSKEITLAGLMAAVMVVVTVITRIPFVYATVPFSMQPLIAILAGMLLGSRLGAFSMLVYILLGLVGLPVFAAEPFGGPAYVLKPTFGFLLGYVPAAFAAGKIVESSSQRKRGHYLLASMAGMGIIYMVGLPYLYVILNYLLGQAVPVLGVIKTGFLPFVLWDLLKAIVVAFLAAAVDRRLPGHITTNK